MRNGFVAVCAALSRDPASEARAPPAPSAARPLRKPRRPQQAAAWICPSEHSKRLGAGVGERINGMAEPPRWVRSTCVLFVGVPGRLLRVMRAVIDLDDD